MEHIGSRDEIGPLLLRLRMATGATQRDVAVAAGVGQPLLAYWEKGHHHPTFENLSKMLRFYGVTVTMGADPS